MAKYDPILGAPPERPVDAAPRLLRGGTMPLVQLDARSSKRKTEPMLGPDGLLRGTVRDLLPPHAASEPAASGAQGERARGADTELLPEAKAKVLVASDRKVSLEGFVPRTAVPMAELGPKVDVSRVDPRRAPTQKIQRRREGAPDAAFDALARATEGHAPSAQAAAVAAGPRRTRGGEPMWIALAVLIVGAIALVGALAWRLSVAQPAVPRGQQGGVR